MKIRMSETPHADDDLAHDVHAHDVHAHDDHDDHYVHDVHDVHDDYVHDDHYALDIGDIRDRTLGAGQPSRRAGCKPLAAGHPIGTRQMVCKAPGS